MMSWMREEKEWKKGKRRKECEKEQGGGKRDGRGRYGKVEWTGREREGKRGTR